MIDPIVTKLAGVSYGNCQFHIDLYGYADTGIYDLEREPENQNDPNAVQVCLMGEFAMGYLSKHLAAQMAPLMDAGRTFQALFVSRNEFPPYFNTVGLTVRIIETTPQ